MTLESRVGKLEKQEAGEGNIVAILLRGRESVTGGRPLPRPMPMAELEALAKRYPKSLWPRIFEGRKRLDGNTSARGAV